MDVDEIGPSLRYASTKVQRNAPGSGSGGGYSGGQQSGSGGGWGGNSGGSGGGYNQGNSGGYDNNPVGRQRPLGKRAKRRAPVLIVLGGRRVRPLMGRPGRDLMAASDH